MSKHLETTIYFACVTASTPKYFGQWKHSPNTRFSLVFQFLVITTGYNVLFAGNIASMFGFLGHGRTFF